ncbi:hypothetical protein [Pseudomonas indica]|uniref:hypothetical protein n=1 Tax=Pseudomonas indica TaxID=137658 RepID=UPI0023FA4580|nr:hypothetical protein [Pseudomonas indica]MBU3056885.1 hypothetical protein [Pseudomonas indica]
MELTIFALTIALIWLAFAYRGKSAALRGASSIVSISSMRIAGLQKMSLHSYWTALAMAVMQHRKCSFEQATVLLQLGDAHPDIDWDEINKTHKEVTHRAAEISQEFDDFVKKEAELITSENG